MSHSILVRSVQHLDLCSSCAERLRAAKVEAVTPLVVAAFARYLQRRASTLPTQARRSEAAREFWETLEPFQESLGALALGTALNELLEHAPPTCEAVDWARRPKHRTSESS